MREYSSKLLVMFKRNKTPQRKEFSFTTNQIFEDIENDKVPTAEKQFVNIQEFLKGSDDLQNTSETLQHLVTKLENLKEDLLKQKKAIEDLVLQI
ncbi:hypothetical protein Trydic_g20160 [Trypoxylus dichotomus]